MYGLCISGRLRILSTTVATAFAVTLSLAQPAHARITNIAINAAQSQSAVYNGATFGSVGTYEKISGIATGEVDPADPKNAVIVDILNAPRNANNKVEYAVNFVLLKPTDLSKGNGKLFAFLPNRGGASIPGLQGGTALTPTVNLNTAGASAGNAILYNQGYSLLVQGWEYGTSPFMMTTVPIAKKPNGDPITGPSMDELIVDSDTMVSNTTNYELSYPAADITTKVGAKLTWRLETAQTPTVIPDSGWEYVNATHIRLLPAGSVFKRGLYEFSYNAKDPVVTFLGAAALRDLMSFLKNDTSSMNPLAGHANHIYTNCNSQPCRTMRDVWTWGFNQDEDNRLVVDGVLNYIAGGDGLFWNYRFSQSGRTKRHHIARHYPEGEFPFSNTPVYNPYTGKTQGRFDKCKLSNTCPKVFEIFSENEYYSKGASNIHTFLGVDIPDEPLSRNYLLSSFPHGAGSGIGICQQFGNPLANAPVQRALLAALDDWVVNGTPPPASRVPKMSDGTLRRPIQSSVGFPVIPARPAVANVDSGLPVFYGRLTTGDIFDYGPRYFTEGIMDVVPPVLKGAYITLAPATDADGNDIAGVRVPDVSVPVATYTGWSSRSKNGPASPPIGGPNDGCDAAGQKIPFAKTHAQRTATGDPRLSLEERYSSHEDYVAKVTAAANALMADRFLLADDVAAYIAAANAASVP